MVLVKTSIYVMLTPLAGRDMLRQKRSRLSRVLDHPYFRLALVTFEVLATIAGENRFTLYEYFITDKVGHKQDIDLAKVVLQNLASFLRALLYRVDLARTSVILTSDHGNIEDLSSRNHTLNDVPTIVWGAHRDQIAGRIKSLADITPAIVDTLTKKATTYR